MSVFSAGNIAIGWIDNSSWADVTVSYSEDTNNPHGGVSAQKVDVQAVRSGAVQLTQPIAVIPGRTYTMTAWLRGQSGTSVNLILQQQAAPYTYYALTPAQLTGDWRQFSATGQVNDSQVLPLIQATSPGTFSVDDVSLTAANALPAGGGVPWPAARFGTLRLWDAGTSWTSLEPLKGVWHFETLDTWVAAAEANGIPDIILTLGQTPAWASLCRAFFGMVKALVDRSMALCAREDALEMRTIERSETLGRAELLFVHRHNQCCGSGSV